MKHFVLLLGLAAAACGHGDGEIDELVGAACVSDRDCENRCYTDSDKFPGGFCSMSCASDNDCPTDTYCVDDEGGMCAFMCPPFECERLGPEWSCRERDHRTGGKVFVCLGG